ARDLVEAREHRGRVDDLLRRRRDDDLIAGLRPRVGLLLRSVARGTLPWWQIGWCNRRRRGGIDRNAAGRRRQALRLASPRRGARRVDARVAGSRGRRLRILLRSGRRILILRWILTPLVGESVVRRGRGRSAWHIARRPRRIAEDATELRRRRHEPGREADHDKARNNEARQGKTRDEMRGAAEAGQGG